MPIGTRFRSDRCVNGVGDCVDGLACLPSTALTARGCPVRAPAALVVICGPLVWLFPPQFVRDGHLVVLAQSFAKNFGLYGERVGVLSFVRRHALLTSSGRVCCECLLHVSPVSTLRLLPTWVVVPHDTATTDAGGGVTRGGGACVVPNEGGRACDVQLSPHRRCTYRHRDPGRPCATAAMVCGGVKGPSWTW